jgi:uncharacterized membrane protein YhhN
MLTTILILFLACAVIILIRAELLEHRRSIFILKPLSTGLVIAIAAVSLTHTPSNYFIYGAWIFTGLVFSLIGDSALMFPSKKAFTFGIIGFSIAHCTYAAAFTLNTGFRTTDIISATALILSGIVLYNFIHSDSMRPQLIFYLCIISIMMNRAFSVVPDNYFTSTQAGRIITGAVLFYLSDVIVGIARFKNKFKYNRLSLALYYTAQCLIALSILPA